MMGTPLGYAPHNVMSVGIPLHENTLNAWAERATYITQLRERVAAIPGVVSAGISTNATPPSNGPPQLFVILGKHTSQQKAAPINFVIPGDVSLLAAPLLQD